MNKIRVIDLLNKIANGEEAPKMVRMNEIEECEDIIFLYDKDIQDYKSKDDDYLFEIIFNKSFPVLNLEVEIIEEYKKIEKLECCMSYEYKKNIDNVEKDMKTLVLKINKLIDVINNLKGSDD